MSNTLNSQRGNTLIGIFVGLVLGVVIAAGVVWYLNRSHSPFQNKDAPTSPESDRRSSAAGSTETLPAKPGEKDRFEFYKILPGGQEAGSAPKAAPPATTPEAPPVANERYFLQAGAFQKKADADNLKGELALIGIEATVTEAMIPDKGKMFRVRSGPYAKAEEMNRARTQMSQGGVQATVVKVKD